MDNRSYLQKADHTLAALTTGGGELLPEKAAEFWDLALKPTVILKEATVRPMTSFKEILPKAGFLSRVLRPGTESTALSSSDRVRLDQQKVELEVFEFKAETRVPYGVVEDNIIQETFVSYVMNQLTAAIGRDMEELVVNGDTTVAGSDPFLGSFNGVRKAAVTNTVNFGSAQISKTLFINSLKAMPAEYLPANRKELRFYTSADAELAWRDTLASRATIAGDRFVLDDAPTTAFGVPVVGVPFFPENLGGGTNETESLLCTPSNIVVGVWRKVTLKTFDEIHEGEFHVVARVRFGFRYTHEPAVVRGYGILKA